MRHTLLPLHERVVLRREYYMRLLIVMCFTVSLAILIGIASLFPIFIKALSAESDAGANAARVAKAPASVDLTAIQQKIANSLVLLNSLQEEKNSPHVSELVKNVMAMKTTLKISAFTASIDPTAGFSMSIQGMSPTRDALVNFRIAFENSAVGNKVVLPVSSLAKSSNIPFSIQLTEKLP